MKRPWIKVSSAFALLVVVLTTAVAEAQRAGHTIHVINRDGTGLRDLLPSQTPTLPAEAPFLYVSEPSWSPDGEQIVFTATRIDDYGTSQIVVVDAAGSQPRLLVDGSNPNWSPDGRHIAFTGAETGIFLMNADGSGREEFVKIGANSPKFSPDGRGFLYSTTTHVLDIAVLEETRYFDFNSGTSRRLDITFPPRGVTWSPDGKWIVGKFTQRERKLAFVSMDPENFRGVTVLLTGILYNGTSYGWSPDGKTIVCAMATDERQRLQIHTFPVPDLDHPQATVQPTWLKGQNPERSNFQPAWSLDGKRIVFVSTR